jgi:hypothetical protein
MNAGLPELASILTCLTRNFNSGEITKHIRVGDKPHESQVISKDGRACQIHQVIAQCMNLRKNNSVNPREIPQYVALYNGLRPDAVLASLAYYLDPTRPHNKVFIDAKILVG